MSRGDSEKRDELEIKGNKLTTMQGSRSEVAWSWHPSMPSRNQYILGTKLIEHEELVSFGFCQFTCRRPRAT